MPVITPEIQQIYDYKVFASPESQLDDFYRRGKALPVRRLRKAEIRRLYFNWLKTTNDVRTTFEQVYAERVADHINYWGAQLGTKLEGYEPVRIGVVSVESYDNEWTIHLQSDYHQPLVIKKPVVKRTKGFKTWYKERLNQYCWDNTCSIDYDKLNSDWRADIYSTVIL